MEKKFIDLYKDLSLSWRKFKNKKIPFSIINEKFSEADKLIFGYEHDVVK